MDIQEEKYFVCSGMSKYGGSFAKGLGIALSSADMFNTEKIKQTWPELWKQYLEMGQKSEANENDRNN